MVDVHPFVLHMVDVYLFVLHMVDVYPFVLHMVDVIAVGLALLGYGYSIFQVWISAFLDFDSYATDGKLPLGCPI